MNLNRFKYFVIEQSYVLSATSCFGSVSLFVLWCGLVDWRRSVVSINHHHYFMTSTLKLSPVFVSFWSPFPPITSLCTKHWQHQQLLRPSLLRPEVDTLPLFLFHKGCCHPAVISPSLLLLLFFFFSSPSQHLAQKFLFLSNIPPFINSRRSPWSPVSTQARIITHKTTIIMTKGEYKPTYCCSPPLPPPPPPPLGLSAPLLLHLPAC